MWTHIYKPPCSLYGLHMKSGILGEAFAKFALGKGAHRPIKTPLCAKFDLCVRVWGSLGYQYILTEGIMS